ncbi:MAG: zinc ribbon domain-containing protein [Desulfovermiculus sp.]|nr:zinc ribbon domain-containing protein [Desulfovermiculus sp.]
MRLYEFRCAKCQHEFEDLVRNDRDPVTCPHCGHTCAERLLSAIRRQGGRREATAGSAGCAAPSGFS